MGYSRYWQPPTENEQISNGIALFSGLAGAFYLFAVGMKSTFFWIAWIISILIVIAAIRHLYKSDFSKPESKIGIDLGIVAIIFLVGSILFHILVTWIFWSY